MDIYEQLQKAGLTGNEAKVYLELVKKGEMSANQIAKNLGMDRTLTYTVLNHLIEKGQINYVVKEKKKVFACASPDNLMNQVKSAELIISGLIKEIKDIKVESKQSAEINVYEGKEALRVIYTLVLKHKELLSFGSTGRAYDYMYESPAIAKEFARLGIKGKIITSKKKSGHEMIGSKNVEFRYADYETEATTSMVGDYTIIHMIKDKPIVILIKNKDITNSYRKHFEALWKIAKK